MSEQILNLLESHLAVLKPFHAVSKELGKCRGELAGGGGHALLGCGETLCFRFLLSTKCGLEFRLTHVMSLRGLLQADSVIDDGKASFANLLLLKLALALLEVHVDDCWSQTRRKILSNDGLWRAGLQHQIDGVFDVGTIRWLR